MLSIHPSCRPARAVWPASSLRLVRITPWTTWAPSDEGPVSVGPVRTPRGRPLCAINSRQNNGVGGQVCVVYSQARAGQRPDTMPNLSNGYVKRVMPAGRKILAGPYLLSGPRPPTSERLIYDTQKCPLLHERGESNPIILLVFFLLPLFSTDDFKVLLGNNYRTRLKSHNPAT